jgi:hypothetical protein
MHNLLEKIYKENLEKIVSHVPSLDTKLPMMDGVHSGFKSKKVFRLFDSERLGKGRRSPTRKKISTYLLAEKFLRGFLLVLLPKSCWKVPLGIILRHSPPDFVTSILLLMLQ